MAGAAIAPALGVISAHFAGRNSLLIQLIVSLSALFIILTNLVFLSEPPTNRHVFRCGSP